MSRWWRAYDEALDDPKLQMLGLELVGAWFNIMCLASKNDGLIRTIHIPIALRISKARAAKIMTRLAAAGLFERAGDDYRACITTGSYRDRPSGPEWAKLRNATFLRDDFTCTYCGVRGTKLECDHVVPVARGGSHDPSNLTTACFPCNRSKRDKTLSEWRQ